jgi:hypothetical protein
MPESLNLVGQLEPGVNAIKLFFFVSETEAI